MHQGEVLTILDVSDTICVNISEELWATLLKVLSLAPLKVLVSATLAVIKGMPGGVLPSQKESELPGEVPDFLSSRVLPTESLKLGNNRRAKASREDATKDDSTDVLVQLWNSRLTKL
jgi:hypothetical protein